MEWKVRQFKKTALKKYRASFIATVFVTFAVAFLTVEGANSVALISRYDYKVQQAGNVVNYARKITDEQFMRNLLVDIFNGGNEPRHEETVQLLRDLHALGNSLILEAVTALLPETNTLLSGYSAGREIVKHGNVIGALGIISSSMISLLFAVFAGNLLIIGKRRYYMDLGVDKTDSDGKHKNPVFKLFYVFRKGAYANSVKVMFFKDLYQFLWAFTIIGGFMKLYEYRVIPYLLADNPNLSRKEAFVLAKQITKGYKWKMFLVDLEFVPWQIIQTLTLGIAGIFFVNPYYYGTQAECYHFLFENYRNKVLEPMLADCEAASTAETAALGALPDMPESEGQRNIWTNTGIIIADWGNSFAEKAKSVLEKYNPFRSYDIPTIVLLFITFSVIGWVWEVILHIIQTGDFVKRGVLNGPWLPIYGFGGCMALIFMKKLLHRPIMTFGCMMAMYGALEYFASYVLELMYGVRWWDYTGYFLNINGRICLEGVLIFAFAGCAVVYFIAPILGKVYDKISSKIKIILCIVLVAVFIADTTASSISPNVGKGITAGWTEETEEKENES